MTRVLLDACVLFPSILRELLLGIAELGLLEPLWSERILREWQFAALRKDAKAGATAHTEILLLKARWPQAMVTLPDILPTEIHLPDPDDIHVLAAAITGNAQELVTANLRDFPTRQLAQYNIIRRDPDGLLLELAHSHPDKILCLVYKVLDRAQQMQDQPINRRAVLRKCGLPRLGKHIFT